MLIILLIYFCRIIKIMSKRSTLDKILYYLNLQTSIPIEKLRNTPIKTKDQFLRNYTKHDLATKTIALIYLQNNCSLHPIGKDLRHRSVFIKNEVPDYYVERIIDTEKKVEFCFDVKSKSKKSSYGWVNEKSIEDYRRFSRICNIKVFIIYLIVENGRIVRDFAYSNISQNKINQTISWDKNMVSIFTYKLGLPYIRQNPNNISL